MNAAAYDLWDKLKKQLHTDSSETIRCRLNGISDIRAAHELANAGYIQILLLNEQELICQML